MPALYRTLSPRRCRMHQACSESACLQLDASMACSRAAVDWQTAGCRAMACQSSEHLHAAQRLTAKRCRVSISLSLPLPLHLRSMEHHTPCWLQENDTVNYAAPLSRADFDAALEKYSICKLTVLVHQDPECHLSCRACQHAHSMCLTVQLPLSTLLGCSRCPGGHLCWHRDQHVCRGAAAAHLTTLQGCRCPPRCCWLVQFWPTSMPPGARGVSAWSRPGRLCSRRCTTSTQTLMGGYAWARCACMLPGLQQAILLHWHHC